MYLLLSQLMRGGEVWKPGVPLSEASARVHLQVRWRPYKSIAELIHPRSLNA
jgi:hypothetical protein